MISWIQTTFQHHFKSIFAVLLAVTIVSFVFTIGASPGIRTDRAIRQRDFFGRNLSNPGVERQTNVDAQISVMMQMGFVVPANNPQLNYIALDRVSCLALADQYKIASPTADELSRFITTFRAFQNEEGKFDARRYAEFANQIKTGGQFSIADVSRVMAENYRIKRVNDLLAGPGFVLPGEVTQRFVQLNTRWTVRVATFDLKTFTPTITPTDAALTAYFDQHSGEYTIPPRVRVDYVLFKAADFVQNEPLNDNDVVAYFAANKNRLAPPSSDPAKPTPDLAAIRPQVEKEMRLQTATRLASKAASDFAFALFDAKIPQDSPAIDQFASRNHGKRLAAPPFPQNAPPAGLSWPGPVLAEAFRLSRDRYYSDALPVGDDQVVLLWQETLPESKPTFAEVRNQVAAGFVEEERSRILTASGQQWKNVLQAKLAAGMAFDAAVASLPGAPKSETKSFGPFTFRQPPEGLGDQVMEAIDRLQPGAISDLLGDRDPQKAHLVHVAERTAPVVDPTSAEFAQIRNAMAANAAGGARALVTSERITAEQKRNETLEK
jgi:peptidyl-prolyl cis-trans isomerase D